MTIHTSHYATVGDVATEVLGAALSVACGSPIDASTIANPATVSLAVVAIIDVLVRHLKELAQTKIAGAVPEPAPTA